MKKIQLQKFGCGILATTMLFNLMACSMPGNGSSSSTELNSNMKEQDLDLEELDTSTEQAILETNANFAMNIFKETILADGSTDKNVLVSPLSIQSALGMAANGAASNTLTEMEAVLAGGNSIAEYNSFMMQHQPSSSALDLANSIWIRNDQGRIEMRDDFLGINKVVYNADAFLAPFDDSTVDDINNWVNEETHDMIPKLIDEISDSSVVYLINAAAFEGKWATPYEDRQVHEDQNFTNSLGETELVTMLYSSEDQYFSTENATGFLKYYKGNDFAFMAILPDKDISLNDYIASLEGTDLLDMYNHAYTTSVDVSIPEFSYDYSTLLNEPLMAMGMKEAFDSGADFSNMATTGSGELYISRVLHKTFIQLDRNGTRAAAVTAIDMTDGCAMVEEYKSVYLDRPFLFAIVDTETGLPVFLGCVNTIQ